jgi:putative RNA 2'-phosphotransferase
MLSEKEVVRISKFLSLVLRHKPQVLNIRLDEQGWVAVDDLLEKLNAKGFSVDQKVLQYVVETNNKKRFALSDDGSKIRASQGHSLNVNLGLESSIPPVILYHGTAEKNRDKILNEGLKKQKRQHVHLSADKETAITVGRRHGKPVVFTVKAGEMHHDGHVFFLSANGVWLTETVPADYLQLL